LSEAQKSATKKPKNELISDVSKGDAILDKGEAMMAIVQSRFAKEIELKALLDKFNAAGIYPKEYEKVVSDFSSLIEKVELEKADKIDNDKDDLIKAMQALDIKSVQYTTLHASEVINLDTKSKGGEKLAPATFTIALEAYKNAENRIAQVPHDEDAVQSAGEEALFAARHARNVNEQVLMYQNQFKISVEAIVLQQEQQLLEIANGLAHKDLRDQPLDKQATTLATAASQLVQAREALAKAEIKPDAANERIHELEKKLSELESKLSETTENLEQVNALLAARDAQIKMLNVTITGKDGQSKAPADSKAVVVETSKTPPEKIPGASR
ncbi:MAG: hypothetical protein HY273_09920, partial [Gammaproteobacteria bacterium]|nr:hypothetical protein [Gammaproteobacteria bacterium]